MSTRKIPGEKSAADNLAAICEPTVWKMWEPRPLTPLWAYTACYRDSFTFFTSKIGSSGCIQANFAGSWDGVFPSTLTHRQLREGHFCLSQRQQTNGSVPRNIETSASGTEAGLVVNSWLSVWSFISKYPLDGDNGHQWMLWGERGSLMLRVQL
jgi:hypothetical protein